ncbi:MAG: hypothetical protein LBV43_06625 [Prevotella sp.]|jgi:hypothetical protein|nr:hypothetical protein [Prevotella sp.]
MKHLKNILLILCLLFSACGEDDDSNIVAGYPNFKINLAITDAELRGANTFKEYVKGKHPVLEGESLGYAGLVVVNTIYATNVPDLVAFDLSCPHEKSPVIRVKTSFKDGNMIARCEECGREYDLMKKGSEVTNQKLRLQPYVVHKTSDADIFRVSR